MTLGGLFPLGGSGGAASNSLMDTARAYGTPEIVELLENPPVPVSKQPD